MTLVIAGRPLDLKEVTTHADTILYGLFPGTEAENGISDIVIGKTSPSGKLPMSFPYATGQIPVYYNHLKTGRPVNDHNKA